MVPCSPSASWPAWAVRPSSSRKGVFFITQGILASSLPLHCGLFCTVLAAVTATVLIGLHVDALRQCFLQPCNAACGDEARGSCRSDALTLVLGVLVALMGLARVPMLDVAAGWAGLQVAHAGVPPPSGSTLPEPSPVARLPA